MAEQSRIPMSSPDLTDAELAAVQEVLATPQLALGPRLVAFESALAAYVGSAHGVGVNSGTSGLHLALIAAGVGPGDLVITTPFSFIASANCILYERAVPVFVDVDRRTGNIDPALLAQACDDLTRGGPSAQRWLPPTLRTSPPPPPAGEGSGVRVSSPSPMPSGGGQALYAGPGEGSSHLSPVHGGEAGRGGRLRALLPVHAFGQPADMDPILALARQYGLAVIEDACEALGSHYKGRPAGTLGDCGVFAFYPNKQITTGEGGMIVTDRADWADLFRSLRNQGRDVFDAWLNHTRLGYNYRLDEMSAALGLAQIQRVDQLIAQRAQVAAWYNQRLADLDLVQTPTIVPETTRMSWFVYVVRFLPPASRDDVMARLAERGIASRPYFTPIHLQPFYRQRFGYAPGDYPVTEELGRTSLALPFSSIMTESQVDCVCDALREAVAP